MKVSKDPFVLSFSPSSEDHFGAHRYYNHGEEQFTPSKAFKSLGKIEER